MALAHLDSSISRSGQIIPFGKGDSANCLLCGTEATLSFSTGPVCPSFSAEACAILQALPAAPYKSAVSLSDFRSVLSSVFLLLFIFWDQLFFPTFTIRLHCVPEHSFLLGINATDEWPDGVRCTCLCSSASSSLLSTLFSDWRRTVSSKFFSLPGYLCFH